MQIIPLAPCAGSKRPCRAKVNLRLPVTAGSASISVLTSTEELQVSRSERDPRRPLARWIGSWEIWTTPRAMRAYVLIVEALTLALAVLLLPISSFTPDDLAR